VSLDGHAVPRQLVSALIASLHGRRAPAVPKSNSRAAAGRMIDEVTDGLHYAL
jgi:hypothetical protein